MTDAPTTCDICAPHMREVQEITRDAAIRLLYPYTPVIPAHLLLAPVRHVERVDALDDREAVALLRAVRAAKAALRDVLRCTGLNLFVNDGREAGQHVPHVHFHVFGRTADEPISPYRILNNLAHHPLDWLSEAEIRERAGRLRAAIEAHWE